MGQGRLGEASTCTLQPCPAPRASPCLPPFVPLLLPRPHSCPSHLLLPSPLPLLPPLACPSMPACPLTRCFPPPAPPPPVPPPPAPPPPSGLLLPASGWPALQQALGSRSSGRWAGSLTLRLRLSGQPGLPQTQPPAGCREAGFLREGQVSGKTAPTLQPACLTSWPLVPMEWL